MIVVDCPTPADTRALGHRLGARATAGTVIALDGELGAGKTQLAKGVGSGLGTPTRVTSPTFQLVALHEEGRLALWHVDLYRLDADESLDDLELEHAADGVLVVEWAARFPDALPADRLEVRLEHAGEGRRAVLRATGPRHAVLLEGLGAP